MLPRANLLRYIAYLLSSCRSRPSKTPLPDFVARDYADVVRDDLPSGLSPARAISGAIDVLPGSSPTYRAPYRLTYDDPAKLETQIADPLDSLNGATVFSNWDLHSAYRQVLIHERDVKKTAFVTRLGQYAWRAMPFGSTNAPSIFQKLMNTARRPFFDKFILVYLDDILIVLTSTDQHTAHVKAVLDILRQHKLAAKKKKCEFFLHELAS